MSLDMTPEKRIRGIRFIARRTERYGWKVYDQHTASYPALMAGIGYVRQDCRNEADAQTEADRLNQYDRDRTRR